MSDQEYFTVHHAMTVNIEPLAAEESLPSLEAFETEIPMPFKVASEFSLFEQENSLQPLDTQNKDISKIVTLLEQQNAKLNLLLSYLLSQQDDTHHRYTSISFGASQLTFYSEQPFAIDALARVKLFLEHPAAAVYCYASVAQCTAQDAGYHVTVHYERLRDLDQDLLIRASLYQQQQLLRQRTLTRQ